MDPKRTPDVIIDMIRIERRILAHELRSLKKTPKQALYVQHLRNSIKALLKSVEPFLITQDGERV